MISKTSLMVEGLFITAVFGYLAFQIVRTWFQRLAEHHPSIKRILVKFHIDEAA